MNAEINKIIEEVKKYLPYVNETALPTNNLTSEEELILIVGDKKYPQRSRTPSPQNTKAFGAYSALGFNEVAFICDQKTLELFSIVGIFFDSMDKAALLIAELLKQNLTDAFSMYLLYQKHVMLVNANGTTKQIDDLLKKYPKHKVLFCWGSKKGYGIKHLSHLNKSKTKINNKWKYNCFIRLNHPSSRSYQTGFSKTCSCYMDRSFEYEMSNLKIQDFKIF